MQRKFLAKERPENADRLTSEIIDRYGPTYQ